MSDNLFFDPRELAYLGAQAKIGKMVRIRRPHETRIGAYSIIDDFTYVSCVLDLGAFCHVGPHVTLAGGVQRMCIGNFVGISAGCALYAGSTEYLRLSFELPSIPEEFRIGGQREDVWLEDLVLLGAHSVVLPGVHLPEGFACAAHTVVRKRDYKPWTLYGGYECREICPRARPEAVLQKIEQCRQRFADVLTSRPERHR